MSVDSLLSRLEGVRKTGRDRWSARCPAHADKHPSLSIAISDRNPDVVLLRCHALCDVDDVLAAVGLTFDALYPERPTTENKSQRRPFFPTEVFEVARLEVAVVAVIAADMRRQQTVSEADYNRLFLAVDRLNGIAQAAYGR